MPKQKFSKQNAKPAVAPDIFKQITELSDRLSKRSRLILSVEAGVGLDATLRQELIELGDIDEADLITQATSDAILKILHAKQAQETQLLTNLMRTL